VAKKKQKINQKREYQKQKSKKNKIFLTPLTLMPYAYCLLPVFNHFRIKHASSSNYRGAVFFRPNRAKARFLITEHKGNIMATEKQILANRNNAQSSTGPKTQKGKESVAQNALKHGLFTSKLVIGEESKTDFDQHAGQMLKELNPAGLTESILAQRIIVLSWRLARVERFRTDTINDLQKPSAQSPLQKLLKTALPAQTAETADTPASTTARMVIKDFTNAKILERLLMYERRIEHSLFKTMSEFQRLKLIRQYKTLNNFS
jgi:hypothetical protein